MIYSSSGDQISSVSMSFSSVISHWETMVWSHQLQGIKVQLACLFAGLVNFWRSEGGLEHSNKCEQCTLQNFADVFFCHVWTCFLMWALRRTGLCSDEWNIVGKNLIRIAVGGGGGLVQLCGFWSHHHRAHLPPPITLLPTAFVLTTPLCAPPLLGLRLKSCHFICSHDTGGSPLKIWLNWGPMSSEVLILILIWLILCCTKTRF